MRPARRFFALAAGGIIAWGCARETIGLGVNPQDASSPADAVVTEVPSPARDAATPPPPPTSMPTSMATERPMEPGRIPMRPPWVRDAGHETEPEPMHPVTTDAGNGCEKECDASAPFCRPDTGKCVKCLLDVTCGSTAPRCDPLTNECVCNSDMDCRRSTGTCDSLTRTCMIGCSPTMTCAQFFVAPICDMSRGVCVDCLSGDDCRGKSLFGVPIELCRRGFCVQCEEEADCADSKRHCQTREGICMDCLKPEHCATGLQCFNGRCIPA